MAADGERRMLFDMRGRRRNVIKVAYAILAFLMVASLFFVVGPFNLGELVTTGGSSSAAKVLDEQVARIEGRLAKDPGNEELLLTLTRAQINAANARVDVDPETGAQTVTPEARAGLEEALRSWQRYLKQAGSEPNSVAAQLVAGTYFRLAENSGRLGEIETNIEQAAAAQRIAAGARPNVGSLSTLAIYEYFSGDFAAGDRATQQAEGKVSRAEAKNIAKQLGDYRKRGKQWEKQKQAIAKEQRQRVGEALQNPLGGLSGSSGSSVAP